MSPSPPLAARAPAALAFGRRAAGGKAWTRTRASCPTCRWASPTPSGRRPSTTRCWPRWARRVVEHAGLVAYGRAYPEFWISRPLDGRAPSAGNGTHFGFLARSRAEVDAFWEAALANGGTGDGAPGPREHYGPGYYGCFVRDPDGNKVEAQWTDEGREAGAGDEVEAHPS